jgi:hypothetical protein
MKIKIKTAELNEFLKRSSNVTKNNILPIYDHLRLEVVGVGRVSLTRASEGVFVVHEMDAEVSSADVGDVVLMELDIVVASSSKAESKEMVISRNGKKIGITDGITPMFFQETEDRFPAIPRMGESVTRFSWDVLDAIGKARGHAKFRVESSGKTTSNFVHTKNINTKSSFIWAMNDQQIVYYKKFKKAIPDLLRIDLDACGVLARHEEVEFTKNDNWMVFSAGATVYGFIEVSCNVPDMSGLIAKLKDAEKHFTISKHPLLSFCEKAVSINPTNLPADIGLTHVDDTSVGMAYNNSFHGRQQFRDVDADVVKPSFEPFMFIAEHMIQILKSITYEKLTFHKLQTAYFLTTEEDDDYIGLINGIAYVVPDSRTKEELEELPFK